MRVVILGAEGQLGSEFREFLQVGGDCYAFSRRELDVTDGEKVVAVLADIRPEVILNCAAYTGVDRAEKEQEWCYRVNTLGARNAAHASYRVGAKIVYFSTDYVFDGQKTTPYTEFDVPHPLSTYGCSKLWGEHYTRSCNPNHLILRTSWLYGKRGHNFIKTILRLVKEKRALRVVDDQRGAPTWTRDLVRQTLLLLEKDRVGLYHCADLGETTWFRLAQAVCVGLGFEVEVTPITTEEYGAPARRPGYSVLENYCLGMEGLNLMRPWQDALREFLRENQEALRCG
jgi:dTDP-4-dehydrorhamnose reductase